MCSLFLTDDDNDTQSFPWLSIISDNSDEGSFHRIAKTSSYDLETFHLCHISYNSHSTLNTFQQNYTTPTYVTPTLSRMMPANTATRASKHCPYLQEPLCIERMTYGDLDAESFNKALWTHLKEMHEILTAVYDKGYRL